MFLKPNAYMQLIVNQKAVTLQGSSISDLCAQMQLQPQGIAIAVNGNVVPQSNWPTHSLNHNDTISIIRATRGG